MTRTIKLYSPALVLMAMAIGTELGLKHFYGALYWVLAISVVLHGHEERRDLKHDTVEEQPHSRFQWRENWYRDIWLFCITLLVVLALAAAHDTSTKNCEQIEIVKSGLRQTLEEARNFAATSPVRTAQVKAIEVKFYEDALAREKPRSC